MFRKPIVVPRNETKAFFKSNPVLGDIVKAGVAASLYFSGAERRNIDLEISSALIRVYEGMVYWQEYRDLPFEFQAGTTFLDNLLDVLLLGIDGIQQGVTAEGRCKAQDVMRFLIWQSFGDHQPDVSLVVRGAAS